MPADINKLPVQKSLLNLDAFSKNSFDSVLYGYELSGLLDDVLLVKYVDETADGSSIKRGSIFVPINVDTKAWRIGQVLLAGPNARSAIVGTYVIFPNHVGIPIANIKVTGVGTVKSGIFLNEQRIFGIAAVDESNNESVASILKTPAAE